MKDLKSVIMQVRRNIMIIKKASVKFGNSSVNGCFKVSVHTYPLNKEQSVQANTYAKKIPLTFSSSTQIQDCLSTFREKLGKRRRELDTLINYRILNKKEVERLTRKWVNLRPRLGLPRKNTGLMEKQFVSQKPIDPAEFLE